MLFGVGILCGWALLVTPPQFTGGILISFFFMLPPAIGGLLYGIWGGVGMGLVFGLLNFLRVAAISGDYQGFYEGGWGAMASLVVFGSMLGHMSQLFQRLQMEQAYRDWEEARYYQAVKQSPNPILSIERNGNVASWNGACEKFFGYDETIIGSAVQHIFWDEKEFELLLPKIVQVFQERKSFSDVEINFRARDGHKLTTRSRLFPVNNQAGQVMECMLGNTNITDIRHLETIEHQHLMNMTLLNEIARLAVSAADMQGMLDGFSECAAQILSSEGVLLAVRNPVGGQAVPTPYNVSCFGSFNRLNHLWKPADWDAFIVSQFEKEENGDQGEVISYHPVIPGPLKTNFPHDLFGRMALRAGGYNDRQLLGFCLIHFTPDKITSHDVTEYRSIAEQVSRQIALGVLKLEALLKEQERTRQLMKANAMITALSHIAAQLEITSEPEQIMEALGEELVKLNVHSLLTLLNPDQTRCTIRYISMPAELVPQLNSAYGVEDAIQTVNACFTIENLPVFQLVLHTRRPFFGGYRHVYSDEWMADLPEEVAGLIRTVLGAAMHHNYIVLPLLGAETILGVLCLWGEDLQEDDLPAASLFASQVSAAIRKARQYREVQQMAITDELTRVYNRRQVMVVAERFFSDMRCTGNLFCILLIDVDHFKLVNDRFGHLIGDQVLREVAARWRKDLRDHDVIGRYGGEEFLVLLQTGDLGLAMQIAERLRAKVAGSPVIADVGDGTAEVSVTISIGLTGTHGDDERLDAVIERADRALYLAKQAGRNCTRMS